MSDITEDPQSRIAKARAHLSEKLDELRRREEKIRDSIAPVRHLQHLASPWLRIGLAALAGLALGRKSRTSSSTAMVKYRDPSVLDAVAKIATIAASAMVLYRAAVDSRRGSVEDARKRNDD